MAGVWWGAGHGNLFFLVKGSVTCYEILAYVPKVIKFTLVTYLVLSN